MIPFSLILLGEMISGGVGSGLYTMLAFAVIAVFVSGLMIGRTPEYLGKKIEVREMWMSILDDPDRRGYGADPVGHRHDHPVRRGIHGQPRRPWPLRGALCLRFHGQQQRQRLCRAECQQSISTTSSAPWR